jgi:hypothetical protein
MTSRALRNGRILQEAIEIGASDNSELDLPCDQPWNDSETSEDREQNRQIAGQEAASVNEGQANPLTWEKTVVNERTVSTKETSKDSDVQNSQADLLAILWKIAGGQEGEIRD